MAKNPQASGRGVLAVLGPTNTGKTHLAIDRMVAHETGLIGLPLRLLAREVYERVAARVGAGNVALVTGEEKINNTGKARFQVCTVEAMPDETRADFVAIDEVQLAADLERGHVFTDRILNLRGRHETMLLGAATVHRLLQDLLPGISVVTRPRMSMLTWAGQKKITRLPSRSAIVAFSADEVYAIAELIRRQRGGAAVVLGSLSPRTRNAQVELYQSGDVDFLVATDAIGMGLNLDLDHVAFAQDRKFDGYSHRRLTPAEMGQIAGRAGRHVRNGTFGVTGQVHPFEDELVERLETHEFDPVKVLVWRNRDLSFDTLSSLRETLEAASASRMLMKSPPSADLVALENLTRMEDVVQKCTSPTNIRELWEVCQIPDYRRISPGEHAELLRSVFMDLANDRKIDENWFANQVKLTDRTDGDMDALSARIAHIRTWTYLSHRPEWMKDPVHWQELTREIENRLSDALHESLTKRFIDRRTSVLMKRLRENAMLEAEISDSGDVSVEGHHVGQLAGFRFTPDTAATGPDAKAAAGAAAKALAAEIERRAARLHAAPNSDIVLASDGALRWLGDPVAKVTGTTDALRPRIVLLADEQLTGAARDTVQHRLDRWLSHHVATLLKPLVEMSADQTLPGLARGVAFRLVENLGVVDRREIHSEIQSLDQDMRAALRRHGVRFGAYHIFVPALLKPAPAALICLLWGIKQLDTEMAGLAEVPQMSAAGRTSFPVNPEISHDVYKLCGFRVLGEKAVRIDILERLADFIRPALSWKPLSDTPAPDGAVDGRSFIVTPAMLSILGATHQDMELVLKGLGYRAEVLPEADILARLPKRETAAAPATEPAAEVTPAGTADEKPAGEQATATPDEPEVAAKTAEEAEAGETADVKTMTLWRSGRTGNQQHRDRLSKNANSRTPGEARQHGQASRENAGGDHRKGPSRHRDKPKQGKRHGGSQRPDGDRSSQNGRPERIAKPERPLDPDSPFAKLAQLKASLEGRNDGNRD
ncbi:MAG: helicase-related protein [Nitratireductor sp.]